jgi:NAD(P)-dependent dehydrogenase (short-subunit alcohol dehydrogenase family)
MSDLFDLKGRVALVTGGSRGIGESTAKTLAAYGAHVIVSSRKLDGSERVAADIRSAGHSASAKAIHIGDVARIRAAFDEIEREHGKLDILVNNAAANPYFGPTIDTDEGAFQKTVDVNIRGYFFSTTSAIQLMKKKGIGGSIVNIASVNGVIPGELQGVYSITKAAVLSMTKVFAKEYAAIGVRVNAVLPGFTDTKFASALTQNKEILDYILQRVPLRRVAEPNEIAGAVLYLVSDAASYTTGATLEVDGGYLS